MAIQTITVPAGQPIYVPKTAKIAGIDTTGDATYSSTCFDLSNVPEFGCYGVYFCNTGDANDEQIIYQNTVYQGVIINDTMYDFVTPVNISVGEVGPMISGSTAIVDQMKLLPQAVQGLIREIAPCSPVVSDGARGACVAISFKTLPAIAIDMRLVAWLTPLANDVEDTVYHQFPIYTSDDMLSIQGVTLCGCGAEEAEA